MIKPPLDLPTLLFALFTHLREGLFSEVGLPLYGVLEKFATRSQRPSYGKDGYFRGYAGRNRSVCCLRYVAS